VDEGILSEYDKVSGSYDSFQKCLVPLIQGLLISEGLKPHSVTGRLKTRESLSDKVKEPDKSYSALTDITDICGVRVITHLPDEIDNVARVIEREFEIDKINSIDKRAISDPDRFGYVSLHYVISMSSARKGLPEYRHWDGLKAEIQIRTIIQHAWAEIEHDLGYKSKVVIPKLVSRRFFRLAAILELADDEFQAIKDDVEKYKGTVEQSIQASPETIEIDSTSIREFLKSNQRIKACEAEISEKTGRALIDTKDTTVQNWVTLLKSTGIATLADLNREIEANADAIVRIAMKRSTTLGDRNPLMRGVALAYLAYAELAKAGDPEAFVQWLTGRKILRDDDARRRFATQILEAFNAGNP
jgi:putative GTP pyrophosphokinase